MDANRRIYPCGAEIQAPGTMSVKLHRAVCNAQAGQAGLTQRGLQPINEELDVGDKIGGMGLFTPMKYCPLRF
jgi:hypothetical protein